MGSCVSKQVSPQEQVITTKSTKVTEDLTVTFKDLKPIDEHALKVPKSAEESVEILAEYLVKPAKNELEIIRAFYVWICENISYNTEAFFTGKSAATSPEAVLKCKTSVCEGYASLFEKLCQVKNIQCKKISGYSKGYGHILGTAMSYKMRTNHAWNVVFINNKWRFIEATWGAGFVNNMMFIKQFSNFYFLTKPRHFIADHFPYTDNDPDASKQWQLLKIPVSLEEFSKALKATSDARAWGVEFPSHQYEIISVTNSCTIVMNCTELPLYNVSLKLLDGHRSPCNDSAVIIKESKTKHTITVRPSRIGDYYLSIFGTVDKLDNTMPGLAEYKIQCISTDEFIQPYPEHHGYYGPRQNAHDCGFDLFSLPVAAQSCNNGEFGFNFKTLKTTNVMASVQDANGSERDDYVLVEQSDNEIYIKARLTEEGYYKLTLFSSLEENSSYNETYNMLVLNKNASKMRLPFPKTFSTTTKYRCRLIKPLVLEIPANSDSDLHFISPVISELLVNGKVYTKQTNGNWNIKLKTGDSGNVRVSGKTNNDTSYWTLYEFVIKS